MNNQKILESSNYEQTFSALTFTKETVKEKEFEKCVFEKCSFIECNFESCKFIDCTFIECVLSAIKPVNSSFMEVKFKDSKVIGFDWTKAKNIRFLEFDTCQLNYSNFSYLKLPELKLYKCVAHEVDFAEADLSEGDFTGTDFERSIFVKTNLTKANFKHAFNYSIDFHVNTLKKAQFSLPEAARLLDSLDIAVEY